MRHDNTIYTIGHSTHPFEAFKALLVHNAIELVVDVRSAPYSRWQPQFNREALERALLASDMSYLFLGRELGARTNDAACYIDGRVQYDLLAKTLPFTSGIDRVIEENGNHRLALMCAEKEPLECHRALLVGKALTERGVPVSHILADGSTESNDSAMGRLLKVLKMPEATLFESREELIEAAAKRQEDIIAFRGIAGGMDGHEAIHDRVHEEDGARVLY